MLNPKLRIYFDKKFNPDKEAFGLECCNEEKKLSKYLREKCRNVFSTEEAYVGFEDKVFRFIGAMQIPVEEAAFEKGVECGIYLVEQGLSL